MKEFPYFIPDGWVATSTIKSTLVSNNSGLRTDSNTWGKALSTSAIVTPNCTQLFKHLSALEVLKEINVMLILESAKNDTSPLFLLQGQGVATQEKASHSRCLPFITLCFAPGHYTQSAFLHPKLINTLVPTKVMQEVQCTCTVYAVQQYLLSHLCGLWWWQILVKYLKNCRRH